MHVKLSECVAVWAVYLVGSGVICSNETSAECSSCPLYQGPFFSQKYNRFELPNTQEATIIYLSIHIVDLYDVSEADMSYSVRFYFRQYWLDPRLKVSSEDKEEKTSLPVEYVKDMIWIPDTYFENEKGTNCLGISDITEHNTVLFVNTSGWVSYGRVLTATFQCAMDLKEYPLDNQQCVIIITSFKSGSTSMRFKWLDKYFSANIQKFNLGSFTYLGQKTESCQFMTFNNSCEKIFFKLQRQIGYFMMQFYLPSILIVVLSWITFWIEMDTGNQISLALLLALTITTLNYGAQGSLPKVSYVKAIDVWFLGCLVFVSVSLMEVALVTYLSGENPSGTEPRTSIPSRDVETMTTITMATTREEIVKDKKDRKGRRRRYIHMVSRVVFPAAFCVFNLVYWVYYI